MGAEAQGTTLKQEEVLKLFKMYEDKGWEVKKQVLTIVTWLTTAIFALIAFAFKDDGNPYTDETAALAIKTALAFSVFMALIIFGSLRHAHRDYVKADELLRQGESQFPRLVYKTISDKPKPLLPTSFRLGMDTIGGVHIFIMYLSFFLVAVCIALSIKITDAAARYAWS